MKRHRILAVILTTVLAPVTMQAQQANKDKCLFNHLEMGLNMGTTGLGLDFTMPVNEWIWLRTGFSYMPKIEVPMTFGVQVGDDASTSQSKFERLSSYLTSFTGNKVKNEVEMIGKPSFWNWNFMVDVFPLKKNRHWHVTAGFFYGPSKVAEAYNKTESMASLLAVSIYNNMYDKVHGLSRRELLQVKLLEIPGLENLGTDPDVLIELQKGLDYNGRMGVHLGNYKNDVYDANGNLLHKKGEAYMMDPDENSMVSAEMKVDAFKPYIGIGYEGLMVKSNKRVSIGFDAGVMLWGGTPRLTTHDGTDLIHDVEDIGGKVGDYVKVMKEIKAFPLINLRIGYKLF